MRVSIHSDLSLLIFIPFTNNAFVVANVRPVAANVKGYITNIYVKNEQEVKKANHYLPYSKPPMNWPTGKL